MPVHVIYILYILYRKVDIFLSRLKVILQFTQHSLNSKRIYCFCYRCCQSVRCKDKVFFFFLIFYLKTVFMSHIHRQKKKWFYRRRQKTFHKYQQIVLCVASLIYSVIIIKLFYIYITYESIGCVLYVMVNGVYSRIILLNRKFIVEWIKYFFYDLNGLWSLSSVKPNVGKH